MKILSILLDAVAKTYGFFGPYDHGMFWSAVTFALLGHALVTFLDVSTRDVHSVETPTQFHWSIFIEDNWKRILRNIILIYFAVRFCPEIFNAPLNDWQSVLAGASIDGVFVMIKKIRNSFKSAQE